METPWIACVKMAAGCARQFAAIRKKDQPFIVYRYADTGRPYLIVDKRAVGAKNVAVGYTGV
jgi:hypothetical protein